MPKHTKNEPFPILVDKENKVVKRILSGIITLEEIESLSTTKEPSITHSEDDEDKPHKAETTSVKGGKKRLARDEWPASENNQDEKLEDMLKEMRATRKELGEEGKNETELLDMLSKIQDSRDGRGELIRVTWKKGDGGEVEEKGQVDDK